jgi:hypothetical protein
VYSNSNASTTNKYFFCSLNLQQPPAIKCKKDDGHGVDYLFLWTVGSVITVTRVDMHGGSSSVFLGQVDEVQAARLLIALCFITLLLTLNLLPQGKQICTKSLIDSCIASALWLQLTVQVHSSFHATQLLLNTIIVCPHTYYSVLIHYYTK